MAACGGGPVGPRPLKANDAASADAALPMGRLNQERHVHYADFDTEPVEGILYAIFRTRHAASRRDKPVDRGLSFLTGRNEMFRFPGSMTGMMETVRR